MRSRFIRTVSTIHRPIVDSGKEVGAQYSLCSRDLIALLVKDSAGFRVCSLDGINGHAVFDGDWQAFCDSFAGEFINIQMVTEDGKKIEAAVRITDIVRVVLIEDDSCATLHLRGELACSGMYGILPGRPSQVRITPESYYYIQSELAD
ncbi:hypothetical protein [Gilvimarinus sp. DA14]|uniref:hypothetical protein n=1 Tax=Gilvimarinus sp. DA14 TaxID=2956798 RepID=UPI0020B67454|nr:hypothetical protein [Gilvimarinus sp. DA14]UTF60289.1 hypothetical protein NHM04_00405 [Gilvimarinus sp. DA14]